MSAGEVICPRCEDRRLVRTTRYEPGPGGQLLEVQVDAICPICSGSGRASMRDLIGRLAGEVRLRDAA